MHPSIDPHPSMIRSSAHPYLHSSMHPSMHPFIYISILQVIIIINHLCRNHLGSRHWVSPEWTVFVGARNGGSKYIKSTWLDNSETTLCFVSISGGPVLAATHESSSGCVKALLLGACIARTWSRKCLPDGWISICLVVTPAPTLMIPGSSWIWAFGRLECMTQYRQYRRDDWVCQPCNSGLSTVQSTVVQQLFIFWDGSNYTSQQCRTKTWCNLIHIFKDCKAL